MSPKLPPSVRVAIIGAGFSGLGMARVARLATARR